MPSPVMPALRHTKSSANLDIIISENLWKRDWDGIHATVLSGTTRYGVGEVLCGNKRSRLTDAIVTSETRVVAIPHVVPG